MSLQKIKKYLRVNYNILDNKSFIANKKKEFLYNSLRETDEF